jgi:hypothetical protein
MCDQVFKNFGYLAVKLAFFELMRQLFIEN